jgi:hypothetical protein
MALTLLLAVGLSACQPEAPAPETDRAAPVADSANAVAFRDTITLTGTLIDATCHARMEADAAPTCEGKYVQAGYPVGVQTSADSGAVWILVTVPQALADYLAATVRVTGVVRSEGVLIPHRMAVQNGSTWTSIM